MQKVLKFFIVCLLALPCFLLGGCDKPQIVFTSNPKITEETFRTPEKVFRPGQKIYFGVYSPDGFKSQVIRIQIFKKDEKSEFWGYNVVYSRDAKVSSRNYYTDFYIIHTPGWYVMQIFDSNEHNKPIVFDDFWVK